MTCSQPILSDEGVLLIGGGTRITEPLLSAIRDRDIRSISIDRRDLLTLQPKKRSLKKLRLEQSDIDFTTGSLPLKSFLVDRFKEDLSEERANCSLRNSTTPHVYWVFSIASFNLMR